MLRRRFAALAAATIAAFGAAACGSDAGPSGTPTEIVRASSEKVMDEGSSRMVLTVETTGATSLSFEGEGAYDYVKRSGRMTLDMSSLASTGFPRELSMIIDGKVIYMNLGNLLPGGKKWAKLDLENTEDLGPQFASLAQLGSSNDPRSFLAFSAGVKDVKEVGEAKVRGEDTTHYTATIDLEAAVAAIDDPELKKPLETVRDTLGTPTIPGEFWVDSEGRLRRYRSDIDMSKLKRPDGQQQVSGSTSTVVEFFDFGTDVEINPPAADEVTDLADLIKQATPTG